MVKRLQRSALVTVLIALCLLLATSVLCFTTLMGYADENEAGSSDIEYVVLSDVDDFAYTDETKKEIKGHKFHNGGGVGGMSPTLNPPSQTGLIQPVGLSEQGYAKAEAARNAGQPLKIVIPEQVEIVGNGAFIRNIMDMNDMISDEDMLNMYGGYENLVAVEFAGDKCWALGQATFVGTGLTSLDFIPKTVTSIGTECFRNCHIDELTINADNSVLLVGATNKPGNFNGNYGSTTYGALMGCYINKLTLSPDASIKEGEETITEIPTFSFVDCNVENFYIPDTITKVGASNFANLISYKKNVKNIYCPDLAKFLAIDYTDEALQMGGYGGGSWLSSAGLFVGNEQDGYEEVSVAPQLVIPADVKKIGDYAFAVCPNIVSVVCEGPVEIGAGAFLFCQGLTEVVFKDAGVTLGEGAFSECSIKYLYAPQAFESTGADGLQNIEVITDEYTGGNFVFYGDCVFAQGDEEGRWNLITYSGRKTDVVFPTAPFTVDGVTVGKYDIPDKLFGGNSIITSIVIPDNSVRYIGEMAFNTCMALKSVTIGSGVEELGGYTFYYSQNINTVTLRGVDVIPEHMFEFCSSLSNVSLADVRVIGESAFEYCQALRSLTIPDSVERIEKNAFNTASSLTELNIGSGVRYIGNGAFAYADITGTLYIPATVQEIDNGAFASNSNAYVTFLTHEDGTTDLRRIGSNAFGFTRINMPLPEGIQVLGNQISAWTSFWVLPESLTTLEGKLGNYMSLTVKQAYTAEDTGYAARYAKVLAEANYSSENSRYTADGVAEYNTTTMVMPNFESYKVVYDEVVNNRETYDAMASTYAKKVDYLTRLFYVDEVTFQIVRGDSAPAAASVKQYKLARYAADGQSIEVCLNAYQTDGPGKFWRFDRGYELPKTIGLYTIPDNTAWKAGETTLDVTPPESKSDPWFCTAPRGDEPVVLIAQVGANDKIKVSLPFTEITVTYSGQKWTLPAEYDDMFVLSKESNYGTNVNTGDLPYTPSNYWVRYELKDKTKYEWADGGTAAYRSIRLYITPYETDLIWEYRGVQLQEDEVYEKVFDNTAINNATDLRVYVIAPDGENRAYVSSSYMRAYLDGVAVDGGAVAAGNWRIDIQSGWNYNYSVGHTSHNFRIEKIAVDLNNYDNMQWSLADSGAPLNSGSLYMYGNVPYIGAQADLGTPEVVYVTRSYARYRNTELTVGINNIPMGVDGISSYTADIGGDYQATAVGKYTATAALTASSNYKFTIGLGTDVTSRGLNIILSDDGTTATITKVWYIVALENRLVLSDGTTDFEIADWQFGQTPTLNLPVLEHGTDNVSFTLTRNGSVIGDSEGFGIGSVGDYLNASMPAGKYVLTAVIEDISIDGIVYRGGSPFVYRFTVEEAQIDFNMTELANGGYAAYEWELDNSGEEGFFAEFENSLKAAGKVGLTTLTPEGYWEAHKEYYGDFTVTYNFARMYNNTYLAATDGNLQKLIAGGVNGTYTVYFQISAPNHYDVTALNEQRYDYYFTVTVFEKLDTPTFDVGGLVYTGNKVLPEIAESDLYEVVWTAGDTYVTGGAHSVSFKLYDNVHYRWKDESGDTVSAEFTIAKADNDFTTALNMLGWNFETFDVDVNNIRAAVKYLDNGEFIHFRVVKEGEAVAIDGLTDFTVDGNGRVSEAVAAALNALKVGEYTLYAKVNGTGNYNEHERYIDFAVGKAMNSWADGDDDLKLPSWIVGKYDPKENEIVVNAAHGQVNIIIADINGKEYYNSTTGLNKLNDCEVGKYLLKAWVDETEDFAPLAERTFTIEVLEKIGLPWWATLLITVGALLVAALIIFILWKKGVFQILTEKIVVAIRTRASVDATIASVRAAKMMEEGKKSVAEAKRRERIEKMRQKAQENRALPPEERAAKLEEKAQAEAERAEQLRAKSESRLAKAAKMRGKDAQSEQATEAEGRALEVETAEVDPPETSTEE